MENILPYIDTLGFDASLLDAIDSESLARFEIARVTAVHRDSCTIHDGRREAGAELLGKLLFNRMSREAAYNDMPYLEKRRKDKQFGKMVKTVVKAKKLK